MRRGQLAQGAPGDRESVILSRMQTRAVRFTLLALLLVTGIAAGTLTFDAQRNAAAVLDAGRDVDGRLERMLAATVALGAAQQAYVAPGQMRAEWLSRASVLLQQLYDDAAALQARMRSMGAAAALRAVSEGVDGVVQTDTRAREQLRIGEDLMAADLVFSEARHAIESVAAQLRDVRAAERVVAEEERQSLLTRAWMALGIAALLWTIGLIALVPVDRSDAPAGGAAVTSPAEVEAPVASPPPIDLAEAARVCTTLSRVTSAAALPDLLGRAARVLDASGLIVWLGAGEELFAATAHGYDPRVVARIGPIPRHAENATAAAWRAAEMRIVPGDMMANGAIVAPLFEPSDSAQGCLGVLAVELRDGREADPATQAVITILAAQLSAIVSAWPAPSVVEGAAPGAVEGPAPSGVEGPTAASA